MKPHVKEKTYNSVMLALEAQRTEMKEGDRSFDEECILRAVRQGDAEKLREVGDVPFWIAIRLIISNAEDPAPFLDVLREMNEEQFQHAVGTLISASRVERPQSVLPLLRFVSATVVDGVAMNVARCEKSDIDDFCAAVGWKVDDFIRSFPARGIRGRMLCYSTIMYAVAAVGWNEPHLMVSEEIARYSAWVRTARCYPNFMLAMENPAWFRPQAFAAAQRMLRAEGYRNDAADGYAFQASSFFGKTHMMLAYLEKWGVYGHQSFHDIIQHLRLPEGPRLDLKCWVDAVMQHGPEMMKMVKYADRLPQPEKSKDGRRWSLEATRAKVALFMYNNAAKNPKLATLCHAHQVDEKHFEKTLDLLENAPQKKNIPEITIDGALFDMAGAKFYRLPANDVRGPFLGELTDCCQYIGGAGQACAEHGVASENGGFYVVEKDGEILGQTWAWRGTHGAMCFDSLETLGQRVSPAQWEKILHACGEELTKGKQSGLRSLTVGVGGATPPRLKEVFRQFMHVEPLDYKGYRDSTHQILVWRAQHSV